MSRKSGKAIQTAAALHRIATLGVTALAACVFAVPFASGQENCCSRSFAVPPTAMPQGALQDWSSQIASAISSAFSARGGDLRHCPLQLEEHDVEGGEWLAGLIDDLSAAAGGARSGLSPQQMALYEMDYLIESSVSASDAQYTATVSLLDHHHGETIRSGSYSWTGVPDPSSAAGLTAMVDATFNPLDDIIYDYERKPQLCRIALEGDSPAMVQAGETVSIRLSEIFDHQSRPSQRWQRVYVKAEKGRILNGREKGEYRVFDVGDGSVSVMYKAPDVCKPDKETVTVYNTCYTKNNPDGTPMDVAPDKELAKKEFDIVCDQWDVTLTYSEDVGGTYQGGGEITVQRNYSGTFKARVKLVEGDGRTATYESKDAEVEIQDNYNHHTVMEECAWRGGFNGSKSGRAPVEVSFRLNTHNHTYHVGLGKWSGDGVTYTVGGNLFGTVQGCSGAWQKEVTSTVLPGGWEKGEGPPESRSWSPGQTSFTFQNSWDDYVTGVWPDCGEPPVTPHFMVPLAYRPIYLPLVFDWGRFPQMKIKKSLSWEVTRPK